MLLNDIKQPSFNASLMGVVHGGIGHYGLGHSPAMAPVRAYLNTVEI
jgi:hypothetical protein